MAAPTAGANVARARPRQRPTGVTLVGWIASIAGALMVIGGAISILAGAMLLSMLSIAFGFDANASAASAAWNGVALLVGGAVYLAIGQGNLGRAPWAWGMTLVVAGGQVVAALVALASQDAGALMRLVLHLVVVVYYLRDDVRGHFFARPA